MKAELIPRIEPGKVKSQRFADYAMRFLFGAGIALVAGLIGMALGPKAGGMFLGFPAVLPASLTLIQKKEGKDEASIDSIGAVLGSIAMIAFAVIVALSVVAWGPGRSILVALGAWVVVAVGLYFAVALVFEREPHPT